LSVNIIRSTKNILKRTGLNVYIRAAEAKFGDVALNPIYRYKGRNIERFVLFIGHHRSGSSILGAMLNSHPEIVISHEVPLLQELTNSATLEKGRIVRCIMERDRQVREWTSPPYGMMGGYTYAVNTQWQGKYSRLRIIGDKNSVAGTNWLYSRPELLDSLRRLMGVPISVFFTYRNPYDIVAAEWLRVLRNERGNAAIPRSFLNFDPSDAEKPQIEQEFISSGSRQIAMSRKILKVLTLFSEDEIFPVKHEDFIASPRENLLRACEFLGVECAEEYLEACAAISYSSPHQTRFKVRWTPQQKAQVTEAIRKYPWFEGYTYED